METLLALAHGFGVAFQPNNLLLSLIGAFVGTVVGSLPGLGPVNGVAILIPLAYSLQLEPVSALILLASVYYGCMYGGRISSILLNIPGDEPAVMTTLDGYPMAKSGRAAEALAISGVASFVGATLATIGLTFFAPLLAKAAIDFGPAEYFALYILAFATIGGVTGSNPAKTLVAAALGIALGTIGSDPQTGIPRYTFGVYNLFDGINFIVAIVGVFAISEFLVFLENPMKVTEARVAMGRLGAIFHDLWYTRWAMLRGSVIGFLAGVLPGAGASLGSFLAYAFERRVSNKEDTFGKGDPRGVAAPEAGNNAAAGGALVPMLTLGVPGSGTTAVLLALLISLNITPGPLLFAKQPEVVWGLIAALYLGNLMLLVLNLPLVGIFTRLLSLPYWLLMPLVVMVGFLGVYSINHSTFDLYMMVAFGVLGYVLRKLDISLVPLILGLLLGNDMEINLRRALSISNGDWSILVRSPIADGIYLLMLVLLAVAVFASARRRRIGSND